MLTYPKPSAPPLTSARPPRPGDRRVVRQQGEAETPGGAHDQTVERIAERRQRARLVHVLRRERLDRYARTDRKLLAEFAIRESYPPPLLEQDHLHEDDGRNSEAPPRRLRLGKRVPGTAAEAAELPRVIPHEHVRICDEVHPRRRRRVGRFGGFPAMRRAVRSRDAAISLRISS